mmetsp:Transcript_10065/g.24772  ORF Transcript_10065/g.24772 Transcript_10065/m.24772 type:complete len:209 (-) Transcript_10065:6263-6889(-)
MTPAKRFLDTSTVPPSLPSSHMQLGGRPSRLLPRTSASREISRHSSAGTTPHTCCSFHCKRSEGGGIGSSGAWPILARCFLCAWAKRLGRVAMKAESRRGTASRIDWQARPLALHTVCASATASPQTAAAAAGASWRQRPARGIKPPHARFTPMSAVPHCALQGSAWNTAAPTHLALSTELTIGVARAVKWLSLRKVAMDDSSSWLRP